MLGGTLAPYGTLAPNSATRNMKHYYTFVAVCLDVPRPPLPFLMRLNAVAAGAADLFFRLSSDPVAARDKCEAAMSLLYGCSLLK